MFRPLRFPGHVSFRWQSWLVISLSITGCAYNEPYPQQWAPVVHDQNLCAHLSGGYSPYDYRSRLVMSWVAGNPDPKPPVKVLAADRLQLTVANQTITATAWLNGAVITQQQYPLQCSGDSLALNIGGKFESGQGIIGYGSTLFRLHKDAAGAIVVNEESSGAGAYGLIPFVVANSSTWVGRFVPYDSRMGLPQPPADRPQPCQYNISQIMVDTQEKADNIEQMLGQGASFHHLAATENRFFMRLGNGLLGWVYPNVFPGWGTTIVSLKKGEYSRIPIKDDAGWHIIKINDIRPADCTVIMAP